MDVTAATLVVAAVAVQLSTAWADSAWVTEGSLIAYMILLTLLAIELFVVQMIATVKRAHDVGWSGHVVWLCWIPYIGGFLFVHLAMRKPQEGPNKYGPYPHGETSEPSRLKSASTGTG